jgi:hypothetical protein
MPGSNYSSRWIVTGRFGHINHIGIYTMDKIQVLLISGLLYRKDTFMFQRTSRIGLTGQVFLGDNYVKGSMTSSLVMDILAGHRLTNYFTDLYTVYSITRHNT